MIEGLFLDPRAWQVDFLSSPFWKPEQFGVKIDLHPDAFNIPKTGIDKKYKFVIATEVWEIPMRKTLRYLKSKGIKVFLIPREPFKTDILKEIMFGYPKFLHEGEYYFNPDVLMAPNKMYAGFWEGKVKTTITGYPRFDYLLKNNIKRDDVIKKYGLADKKIIFFPSYPPYYHRTDGMTDIYDGQEQTLQALAKFAKDHKEYQVVVKIHPMSFKCYTKKTGKGNEVAGTLLEYYKKPTDYMKVIGDVRMSGDIAKELLCISDIAVGFTSTMLLEALVLDKYVLHLLMGNTVDVGFTAYKDLMPTAYNEKEMHAFINNPSKMTTSSQLIEDYLFKVDGKCCERICETIKGELA
jgi:CDP-glycerol glycerophosphotransferase (TagB/SpsB family)